LRSEICDPRYRVAPLALGTNTDPYQTIEAEYEITRRILEVLEAHAHPVTITTKSARVCRDIDILSRMAARGLVSVALSVTSLDPAIASRIEPRASAPAKRMQAVKMLSDAGVPVTVGVSPIIPAVTDHELEAILGAAARAGARGAFWLLVRLPHEVSPIFRAWLDECFPDRAGKVMSLIQATRDGRDNDPDFFSRFQPTGVYADMLRTRFNIAVRKLGLDKGRVALRTDLFRGFENPQLSLL
jgi:DNA repair photolyase